MKTVILSLPIMLAAAAVSAQSMSETETKGFVGVNWVFGQGSSGLEGVLGVARIKTESDGDARGGKLSAHFGLGNGVAFRNVKLSGLSGDDDLMGELGIGWGTKGLFGNVGLWGDYANIGANIYRDDWEGYVGIHSLDIDAPSGAAPVVDEGETPSIITPGDTDNPQ
ncbi:hypothetical protein [Pseudothioclava nitratireducens]|uniref:hypothetical protein n=1 Tax=Pseudothioclava nitratireducens TaxID=1928646 RepID=UPI0023DA664F|nr:hypothetical protein [Defluviimonas nitratireducens]MDF1620073.1 hypothetical protein [Defluviimonas nitratireducens]